MQTRFRKSRCNQRTRSAREFASSCFNRGLILTGLLFLQSCTQFTIKEPLDIQKGLSYFCSNQEGKGRVSYKDSKQVFSYETFLEKEKSLWAMSVFFPLHGEEDIEISLDPKKQFVKGSFPATIKKLSGSEKKKAMIFLKELNSFIRLLQSPKLAICKESDSCTFENKTYVLSQDKKSFALSRSLALGKFEVKLENLNAVHAEKIDIKYFDANQDWRSSLRLELLMSKCYAQ